MFMYSNKYYCILKKKKSHYFQNHVIKSLDKYS